jgi:hypothetical protein
MSFLSLAKDLYNPNIYYFDYMQRIIKACYGLFNSFNYNIIAKILYIILIIYKSNSDIKEFTDLFMGKSGGHPGGIAEGIRLG